MIRRGISLTLVGLLAILAGCAGWKDRLKPPSVTADREARSAEAIREFEERRDSAQLEAALDRWKQGDAQHAEASLAAIASRRPDHADARLRLAELLWSRGDIAAEGHLRAVIEMQPNRAEAHHALGLLLDATGRGGEARQHLARAAELEPDNEVYRLTRDSLIIR